VLFSVVRFARKEKEKKYRKKDTFRSPESGTGTPRTPSFVIKKNQRMKERRKYANCPVSVWCWFRFPALSTLSKKEGMCHESR
jgi:hypothetical protein